MLVALDGDVMGEADKDTRVKRYATDDEKSGHSSASLSTASILGIAGVLVIAVWTRDIRVALVVAGCLGLVSRSRLVVILAVLIMGGGVVRSDQSWSSLTPNQLGAYEGWARVVDDPQPYPGSTRVILEVDGERFETWSRGRARQLRVREWRGGEWVAVNGVRAALDAERAQRVAWQHIVGEFEVEWASDVDEGGPVERASNRVRGAIERAASELPDDDGALFRGLVVGDDRDQPREMINRFRASGLSHLTAVSGQNVSFLLASAGPFLRRLRPWGRWVVTVGLIAWFVALTRYEPSIVRAGAMAGLSATAFVMGRERAPIRILGVAVIGLVLVDPLLVWSVGFWLSVGATLGVSSVGPWIAR
ncbi:MAG: competence protein ComEC, partial [Candidatus Aldehydirespiratoraceae bacterium]